MSSITVGGTHFEMTGPDDAAHVVLVHGLGLNRRMWQCQLDALSNYRLITYDLVGHGETPPQREPPSLTTFSDQLRELLDHLGIAKAGVAGFSLGGMIVRRFAMDHPDRLWALGILSSAHVRSDAAQKAVQDRGLKVRREGPAGTVENALERWFSADYRERNPAVMDQIRTWILANDRDVYPGNYQVLADGVDELVAPDPAIACPALVMTGDQDFGNSPEMSRAIADEIAGARLVILEDMRHMAMVEAPERYNRELLSFLDDAAAATA